MITETYIKMCEQAEELQELGKKNNYKLTYFSRAIKVNGIGRVDYLFAYLPTLEQLFEMVGDYKAQISRVFLSIMIMKKYKFESIQELVLNAVMEIKYNKAWTGEKWEVMK